MRKIIDSLYRNKTIKDQLPTDKKEEFFEFIDIAVKNYSMNADRLLDEKII